MPTDLLDRHTSMGNEPTHKAFGDMQPFGHIVHIEEPGAGLVVFHDPCKPLSTVRGDMCHAGSLSREPARVYVFGLGSSLAGQT
jgi:hypothetical protein